MPYACKLLVLAALLWPVGAVAQDAAGAGLARQVVDLAVAPGIDGRFVRMIGEAVARQPADRQAELRAGLAREAAGIREELLAVFSNYYATAFTPAELKDLVAFYESPLGKKAVTVEQHKPAAVEAEIQQRIMRLVILANPAMGEAR